VEPGETEAALAARVLALEHALLPRCIAWFLEGRVRLDGQRVRTQGLGGAQLLAMAAAQP
jgi:phosphoribosylglycinamide formyltransferase-1